MGCRSCWKKGSGFRRRHGPSFASRRTGSCCRARAPPEVPNRQPGPSCSSMRSTDMKWFERSRGLALVGPEPVGASEFTMTEPQGDVALIDKYSDVPPYLRLLTGGDEPVYRLPADQQERLIATDIGGKRVHVFRATMPTAQREHAQWQLRALKGDLRAKGYQVVQEFVATPEVMRTLMRNVGLDTQSRGR